MEDGGREQRNRMEGRMRMRRMEEEVEAKEDREGGR